MFRSLSEEENQQVKRWQAPQLGPSTSLPLENVEQTLRRIEAGRGVLGASVARTDIAAGPAGRDVETTAHAQAEQVIEEAAPSATEELAALRDAHVRSLKQAREEAFAAGFAEGNVKAHDSLAQEIEPLCQALALHTQQLERSSLEQLVHLACDMASLVLQQEISLHPEKLLGFVERALAALPDTSEPVSVRVHPQDYLLLRDAFASDPRIQLREDAALACGDCRVNQGRSEIRTGFAALLAQMAADLTSANEAPMDDAGDPLSDANAP